MSDSKNNSTGIGNKGENLAKSFLIKNGYRILEQNWRFKKLEIDLIAQKDDRIIFVEVKTRKNSTFGEPQIFVSKQKQSFIIKAAHHYLESNNIILEARFDIIAVTYQNQVFNIQHLERAFYPLV